MAAQAAPKTPRFDLQDVDPGRRAKAWSDALNEYFFRYDVEYPTEFRIGEFDGVAADGLRLATMTADPMHVERHASHIAADQIDAYFLILPRGGDILFRQRGHEVKVGGGQFTFVSTTEPYGYRQDRTESYHTLLIPGPVMRARKPDADDHLVGDFRASGMQQIFADFAASFCRQAGSLDAEALRRTHDSLLDMLALVLERADAAPNETAVRLAHRRRVLTLVESRFREPEIGLAWIAQALGLSPRYVQQILATHRETVSDLLRRRRMAEACRLLDRRGSSRASVATIAYSVGYTDPAYFSRVFRQSMGMSPMDYASRGR
jgi:AraC-like DNA-binding protein